MQQILSCTYVAVYRQSNNLGKAILMLAFVGLGLPEIWYEFSTAHRQKIRIQLSKSSS